MSLGREPVPSYESVMKQFTWALSVSVLLTSATPALASCRSCLAGMAVVVGLVLAGCNNNSSPPAPHPTGGAYFPAPVTTEYSGPEGWSRSSSFSHESSSRWEWVDGKQVFKGSITVNGKTQKYDDPAKYQAALEKLEGSTDHRDAGDGSIDH